MKGHFISPLEREEDDMWLKEGSRRPVALKEEERSTAFDKGHIEPFGDRAKDMDDREPPIRLIDETDKPIWSPKTEDDKAPICPIEAEEDWDPPAYEFGKKTAGKSADPIFGSTMPGGLKESESDGGASGDPFDDGTFDEPLDCVDPLDFEQAVSQRKHPFP